MITAYEGTLGSGKTYHAVKEIIQALRQGKNVISDINFDASGLKGMTGRFYYWPEMSVPALVRFDELYHDHIGFDEHQTLVVIDETYNYFDPRDFDRADRALWVSFLKVSRHYCFDFLLIGQDCKTDLDKKIYRCIEYTVVHKNLTRLQWGFQLFCLLTGKWFCCIQWSCSKGVPKIKLGVSWLHLNKRFAARYDSHQVFSNSAFARQLDKYQERYGLDDLPEGLEPEEPEPPDPETVFVPEGGERVAG